ncbi:MAG: flagellar basal body rod protein FlgC [Deltaproteobacteria bacterium]|nr:flagellar basal body rod protein FlgC [Deltaproteobacteria bacterium]MDZ4340817.1 flagellar basal body rod protein FlgC [Candidatus Binatia bacterium]
MDLFKIFFISSAGMSAQRSRMTVVAGNLANAETTRTPEGGPYKRRDVIFQAAPAGDSFADFLGVDAAERAEEPLGVEVAGVRQSSRPPRKIFDPHHPDANAEGYVALPDINAMEEMVDMMSAARSYEANLSAFNTTKSLIRRLLEIGRGS